MRQCGTSERVLAHIMTAVVTALGLLPLAIASGTRPVVKSRVRARSSSSEGSLLRPPSISWHFPHSCCALEDGS
jgi:hypothetical protein